MLLSKTMGGLQLLQHIINDVLVTTSKLRNNTSVFVQKQTKCNDFFPNILYIPT